MVFTILMLLAISFVITFLIWKVQKNKTTNTNPTEKCPCPDHNLQKNEEVVGYKTAVPTPAVVVKKKPATKKKSVAKKTATKKKSVAKKTATKKTNSSQKKK